MCHSVYTVDQGYFYHSLTKQNAIAHAYLDIALLIQDMGHRLKVLSAQIFAKVECKQEVIVSGSWEMCEGSTCLANPRFANQGHELVLVLQSVHTLVGDLKSDRRQGVYITIIQFNIEFLHGDCKNVTLYWSSKSK